MTTTGGGTPVLRGPDVSTWQGAAIDWKAVKASGASFAAAKCSEGVGYVDPTFSRNWAGIADAGLARIGYHFARPDLGNTPQAEADWFLSQVTDVSGGDILVVDMESPPRGSGDLSSWCLAWLHHVEAQVGVRPWVYTGQWYALDSGRLMDPALGNYPLWNAAYGPIQPAPYAPWAHITLWQHTDRASYPGLGACDENLFAGTIEQLRALGEGGVPQFVITTAQHLRAKPDALSARGELLLVGAQVTGTGLVTPHWRAVRAADGRIGWVLKSNMAATPPALPQRVYMVRSGDTLSSIGAQFQVAWEAIYAANVSVIGPDPNALQVGERLVIPTG